MQRFARRLRVGMATVLSVLLSVVPVYVSATATPVLTVRDTPDVFITEFQTNAGSASQEFIELYNATDSDINFNDPADAASSQWKIQFFNSTSVKSGTPTWNTAPTVSNSITLSGVISAHDYFIVSSTDYKPRDMQSDQSYDAASSHVMTDTGGGLQLLSTMATTTDAASIAHDRVMWLDPATNPVMPWNVLPKPGTGKSQQRIPNEDNEYITEDNNLTGFMVKDDITPLAAWIAPELIPPVTSPVDPTSTDSPIDPPAQTPLPANEGDGPVDIVRPLITELLPNPAAPQTDTADEFIELYNPNATDFDVKDYSLEVGISTIHKFTFTDSISIPARSYQVFYSRDTHLSLSNSSGQARLRDPAGGISSEMPPYDGAGDNISWSLINGAWQWTTTPTPGGPNELTTAAKTDSPVTAAKASVVSSKSAAKATLAKKPATATAAAKIKGTSSTKKAKAKPIANASTKKKKTKNAKTTSFSTAGIDKPKPPIHTGILVAVAASAVLYGLYEYRHDISNKLAQFRANRRVSRPNRSQAAWRRGYSTE